jgi:hypothetical protein
MASTVNVTLSQLSGWLSFAFIKRCSATKPDPLVLMATGGYRKHDPHVLRMALMSLAITITTCTDVILTCSC